MSQVTEDYEKDAREKLQPQLSYVVPRELLPNGSYAPLPGIYDVAWKEWLDMPGADFAKEMRRLDDSIIRENSDWLYRLGPMVMKGELTLDQVKRWETDNFLQVDNFAVNIARNVFDNVENREVRDIILRHSAEETGHGELKADFLVNAFGINREEVWDPKNRLLEGGAAGPSPEMAALKKESPILAYAQTPFGERMLPMMNSMWAKGLRKHYGFKARVLGFYDLHTYVDIYHERLGLYLLGKYMKTKKQEDLFRDSLIASRKQYVATTKAKYESLLKVAR